MHLTHKVDCKNLKAYNKKVVTSLRAEQASAAKTAHYSVLPILDKNFWVFFRSTRISASAQQRRGGKWTLLIIRRSLIDAFFWSLHSGAQWF